jgi:putative hydrolase of the HAD superfamily
MLHHVVLFDLDDTLYPERTYVLSGFYAVAKYLGQVHNVDREYAYHQLSRAFEQGIRGRTFDLVLEALGIIPDETLVSKLVEVYRSHEPELVLYPDAERILTLLHRQHRLGLITDGYAGVQTLKAAALRLQQWFEVIVYTDTFGREHWKPSTRPCEHALASLGVEPVDAVYVGDNPRKDFVGARKLGIHTIRIIRPDTECCDLQPDAGFEADHEITTLDDLPAVLETVFSINKE